VATTSRYLHARPGDSSARFLPLERIPLESRGIDLHVHGAGVMNVLIADKPAKGEHKMSNNTAETKDTAPVSGEPPKKANVGAQKPRVASTKAKSPKKGHPGEESAQSPENGQTGQARPRGQQDGQGPGPAKTARRRQPERNHESDRMAAAFGARFHIWPTRQEDGAGDHLR
jgi:hypothetical protein